MTTEPNNVGASNEAERTIMVVNEDENQIVKNEVMNTDREKVSQVFSFINRCIFYCNLKLSL